LAFVIRVLNKIIIKYLQKCFPLIVLLAEIFVNNSSF